MLEINNITATGQLIVKSTIKQQFNLKEIANKIWNCEYNPRQNFNMLKIRLRSPRATCLLYANGKVVIVGVKSIEQAQEAGNKLARKIAHAKKTNIKFDDGEMTIHNIVASTTLGYRVDFESLVLSRRLKTVYEPQLFAPAIKIICTSSGADKLIAKLFYTGKIIFTGTKNFENIVNFNKILQRILWRFKL